MEQPGEEIPAPDEKGGEGDTQRPRLPGDVCVLAPVFITSLVTGGDDVGQPACGDARQARLQ